MSETDMSNNQHFPEANDSERLLTSQQTDEPANLSEQDAEDWLTVNFPNAIRIDEIEGKIVEEPAPPPVSEQPQTTAIAPWSTSAPFLSESDAGITNLGDLIALVQQLRQRNYELSQRVISVENALHNCQNAVQLQQTLSQSQETLLTQRTQDLEAAQAHIIQLTHKLETAYQESQCQKQLIYSLSEQLEISQQRLAQIERECTVTQQRYSEQSHRLLQTETTCRDLRARLHRQQRHTLQLKAALEKCLEMPESSNAAKEAALREHRNSEIITAGEEELKELQEQERTLEALTQQLNIQPPTVDAPVPIASKADPIKPWAAPPAEISEPAASQPVDSPSAPATPDLPENYYLTTPTEPADSGDSSPAGNNTEIRLWQELAQLIDSAASLANLHAPAAFTPAEPAFAPAANQNSEVGEPANTQVENPAGERGQNLIFNPPNPKSDAVEPQPAATSKASDPALPNWPSPIVYPQQPPKKRQSLAAIDLPTFPRIQ